jgi:hypothetical protein
MKECLKYGLQKSNLQNCLKKIKHEASRPEQEITRLTYKNHGHDDRERVRKYL